MVVFAAHCRNIYGIAVHGSTHMIDTAVQGFISLLAVVQEGDQEEKWHLFISKLIVSAMVKPYFRVKK